MIDLLSTPANLITIADVEQIITSNVSEGEQIEFKEGLSTKGQTRDPWETRKDTIGDKAKNSILEESVAFANAHGGALLIGVKESTAKPPLAAGLSPVPRCVELADRLRLIFRDRVEPELPQLEVIALPTDGDDGVIVMRVGRSRLAPHRVTKTRVCPVRRSDRCEELSMREIQDMTLNVSRGLERLDKQFVARTKRFQQEFDLLADPLNAFGIRCTAVPVGEKIRIDRVFRQKSIVNEFSIPRIMVVNDRGSCRRVLESPPNFPPPFWRPLLRGTRADLTHYGISHEYMVSSELYCDGLIELNYCARSARFSGTSVSPDWPIVIFAHLMVWADRIRKHALAPTAEYAIEVEFRTVGTAVAIGYNDSISLAMVDHNQIPKMSNRTFPRYPLGDTAEFTDLLYFFERDFWNWIGTDIETEQGLTIAKP